MSDYRLLVIDPSGRQREFPLGAGEMWVGSSEHNHIIVDDADVSEQHLMIGFNGTSFWFQEDQSSTGTLRNGERVYEGWLEAGVELQIGRSRLLLIIPEIEAPPELDIFGAKPLDPGDKLIDATFLDGGFSPAAKNVRARREGNGLLILAIAAYVIGFAVLVGGGVVFASSFRGGGGAPVDREATMVVAMNKTLQGGLFMRKQQWPQAAQTLREAALETPKTSSLRDLIDKLFLKSNNEYDSLKKYNSAQAFYGQKNGPAALDLLKQIPSDRHIYSQAQALFKTVYAYTIQALIKETTDHLDAKRLKDGADSLSKLFQYAPNHAEGLALRQRLENLEAATPEGQRRLRAAIAKFQTGVNLFRTGRQAAALDFFKQFESANSSIIRRKAKGYVNSILSFKSVYAKGRSALRRGDYGEAISLLSRARAMDGSLGGGNRSEISSRLSTAYASRGSRHYAGKRYGEAFADYNRAMSVSSNAQARAGLARLRSRANVLYNDAKLLKGVDDGAARKLYRQILQMVPRSDSLYRKARSAM